MITVADLISQLQDAAAEVGEDAEVRLAMQPSWPFEYSIGEVTTADPRDGYEVVLADIDEQGTAWWVVTRDEGEPVAGPYEIADAATDALDERLGEPEPVVYIGEGTQLAYLPGAAARSLGWR